MPQAASAARIIWPASYSRRWRGSRWRTCRTKGAGPALSAVLAGEVGVIFSSSASVIGHAKAGRVRMLAVTGPKRTPIMPDIPTIAESGVPGY